MIISLLLWASIQLAMTISPGPAFAMQVRTSIGHGRRSGIGLAFGVGLAASTLMVLVACGLTLLLQKSLILFSIMKFAGAAYLAYIGLKALCAKKKSADDAALPAAESQPQIGLSNFQAFRRGYLTNILNPKPIIFLTAIFSQFLHHGTPYWLIGSYCLITFSIDTSWFVIVAIVLTHRAIRQRFLAVAHWVERICGALLVGLALKLALFRPAAT